MDSLTAAERKHIIKTRWVIRPRPSSTRVDEVDGASAGHLKAKLVAKGYSQHIRSPHQADLCSNTSKYLTTNTTSTCSTTTSRSTPTSYTACVHHQKCGKNIYMIAVCESRRTSSSSPMMMTSGLLERQWTQHRSSHSYNKLSP